MTKKAKQGHWTEDSSKDFLYRIASDFVEQIQERMRDLKMNKTKLARAAGLDKSRISQLLNNPGNLGLESIIKLARAVQLKVTVVAYDDLDAKNKRGPINADIFRMCWEKAGKPLDVWNYEETAATAKSVGAPYRYDPASEYGYRPLINSDYTGISISGYPANHGFGVARLSFRSAISEARRLTPQ